jgi:hypothetical protein
MSEQVSTLLSVHPSITLNNDVQELDYYYYSLCMYKHAQSTAMRVAEEIAKHTNTNSKGQQAGHT